MSHVATPSTIREGNPTILPDDLCSFCEEAMDTLMEQMEDNSSFILPGGTPVSAQLQFADVYKRQTLTYITIFTYAGCVGELHFFTVTFGYDIDRHRTRCDRNYQNWKSFRIILNMIFTQFRLQYKMCIRDRYIHLFLSNRPSVCTSVCG